jgi:inorganic pyrophosphatase
VDLITMTVIVEIPKGSRNKYEFDERLGLFKLDRMLFSSVHYPAEYGFVRETLGDDGDPLDALVIAGEPTFTGCAIEAKPLGLFQMRDEKGLDDKILSVPVQDPQWNWMETLDDVPQNLLAEIQHFFSIYKDLEDKGVTVEGWQDRAAAVRVIEAAKRAFREAEAKGQ